MGELESKVLELLNREYAISYITRELNIKDEYLADIIIGLEDKGLIALIDKKWKISEKGKDVFEKRGRLLKKLKIEYLYGEIGNRDEYEKKRKELEDISQIISSTDEMVDSEHEKGEHEKDEHEKDEHEKDEHEKEGEIAKTEVVHPEITLSPEIQVVEQKSEDEPLNSDTTRYEPLKESPKEEPIKKICSKCGIENKPESNYCRKCGTVLKD